jgi:3-phosphoshikimate 1-carboxyvinyltransferase
VIAIIQPSKLSGIIKAPASKSSMQRACAAALLSKKKSIIHNPGHSNDDKAAVQIIQNLGAKVQLSEDELIVESDGVNPISEEINCGESGLSIRMFTPIAALSGNEITINGTGSLLNRPMNFFDEVLPQLGVNVQSNNGKLPIKIKGPLKPKTIEIDGSLSSQFLTGLLMAFAAATSSSNGDGEWENFSIRVKDLKSKPYIDLTLDVMKQFGMNVPINKAYSEFIFTSTHDSRADSYRVTIDEYTVESDWSGGAFLLVAGCIAGPITVRGLDLMSTQADKKIMEALSNANANVAVEAKGIKLHPGRMSAFEFDATDCPDLFPPLVALASYCDGETKIKGVSRLVYKESDRAMSLKTEFGKMGVEIEIEDDIMIIYGSKEVKAAAVHSHHDHRIAMACAVAALKASGETTIEAAEAVDKSYPDFFDDLKTLHADVSLSNKIKF